MLFYTVLLVWCLSSALGQPGNNRRGLFNRIKTLKSKEKVNDATAVWYDDPGISNQPPPEQHQANAPLSQIPRAQQVISPSHQIHSPPNQMPIAESSAATGTGAVPGKGGASRSTSHEIQQPGTSGTQPRMVQRRIPTAGYIPFHIPSPSDSPSDSPQGSPTWLAMAAKEGASKPTAVWYNDDTGDNNQPTR